MTHAAASPEVRAWHAEAERAINAREFRRAHELCMRILAAEPRHADALFLLAMIAAAHGNFHKALEVVDRALQLDALRAEYHAQRSRCLVSLHRPREAFEAAERALALRPTDALTLDTIGVALTRAGAHAEAVAPFRAAAARGPRVASYRYNLGAALQFVGELDAAAAEYRAALAIDPRFHRAWSALAQVERAPFTQVEVAELERQLLGALDVDGELHLCHALAKQREDEGRYAESFGLLERGKRRKRAQLDYSFDMDRALFAAVEHTSAARGRGLDSHEPIFIVGMPRTGTTLVERILSSHSAVYAAGELTNFALVVKRAAQTSSNRVLDVETLATAANCDPAAIGAAYVESTRPRTGRTPRFIDKMPLNFFYAGLIRSALPAAKIVCLRRNPLDACLSNYRQLFATSFAYYHYAYDLLDTGRYFLEFDALAAHWRRTLGASYLEIHYEDVVDHTEREARRLIDFCELDWEPECLAFEKNVAPVATASSAQVRRPIYRTAIDRWRNYEAQLEPLRRLLADAGAL
jgi:tetratricopeptide (TPR) repeat protein